MVGYFFDTYAIIESFLRNPSYNKFSQCHLVTLDLNRIEMYWWALTRYDQGLADVFLSAIVPAAQMDDELIRDAMMFRKKYSKRDISYVDSIGYTFAQKNKLLFLTGDEQFRDLPGVEFVK